MSAAAQHGAEALEKSGAATPVAITMPDDESHVGADEKPNNNARLIKYAKAMNYSRIAMYLFFLLAMVGIIVLALQVSKDQDTIQTLNNAKGTASVVRNDVVGDQIGGRMSYLEGFSGMIDDDDTATLVVRDAVASGDPSSAAIGTCSSTDDTTVSVLMTTTTFLSAAGSTAATEELTTTSDTIQTTVHTLMTTTVFSNTTGSSVLSAAAGTDLMSGTAIFSMDPLSASIESPTATTPAVSTTATINTSGLVPANPSNCLEFGDGAGPCNRPYGSPNSPPGTIVVSVNSATITNTYPLPSLSEISSTSPSLPGGVAPSASLETGAMSGTGITTSSTMSGTDMSVFSVSGSTETTTSSAISNVDTSVCGPPTTIYVTLSPSTDTLSVEGGVTISSNGTSTGPGPSTVTSGSTTRSTTITVTLASITETISNSSATTRHLFTPSGLTLTMTQHGNGTYIPTTTGPSSVASVTAASGADKATGGKPMGASGNGGVGNGQYCAVMLVCMLALLL